MQATTATAASNGGGGDNNSNNKSSAPPPAPPAASASASSLLRQLLDDKKWDEAIERVRSRPEEASTPSSNPSPLAVACRSGAPYECVEALLDAAPDKVRDVCDSRGTPLHEAIARDDTGVDVVAALLHADEALSAAVAAPDDDDDNNNNRPTTATTTTTRATLLQDIDGFTPLHLLIRRRFQSHILAHDAGSNGNGSSNAVATGEAAADDSRDLMKVLDKLVTSCPEAVVIRKCSFVVVVAVQYGAR